MNFHFRATDAQRAVADDTVALLAANAADNFDGTRIPDDLIVPSGPTEVGGTTGTSLVTVGGDDTTDTPATPATTDGSDSGDG